MINYSPSIHHYYQQQQPYSLICRIELLLILYLALCCCHQQLRVVSALYSVFVSTRTTERYVHRNYMVTTSTILVPTSRSDHNIVNIGSLHPNNTNRRFPNLHHPYLYCTATTQPRLLAATTTTTSMLSTVLSTTGGALQLPMETTTLTRIAAMTIPFSTTSIMVAATLLISAFAGLWVEQQQQQQQTVEREGQKWRKILPPPILATLMTSTTFVYIFQKIFVEQALPQQHFLYDYCWSTILPSSLALLLFSLPSSSSSSTTTNSIHKQNPQPNKEYTVTQKTHHSALASIQRLAIPFIIASIGSIIGCLISFFICYYYDHPNNRISLLAISDASSAAACLCASFIGGSINFFSTSVIIQQQQQIGSSNSHALLSAMAAVDIVVMAFYFTILSTVLQSSRLQLWFNGNNNNHQEQLDHAIVDNTDDDDSVVNDVPTKVTTALNLLLPVLTIGTLTLILVEVSKRLESILMHRFHVPGTACAFLAILVPWMTTFINIYSIDNNNNNNKQQNRFWKRMQDCAELMSRIAFLLVFATMGCTADLSTAFYNGPACLFFSFTALIVHGIVTLFGSLLLRQFMTMTKISNVLDFDFADVLIASNAAIGGPATAAAFCGQIRSSNPIQKRNRTIAASVWGVVGYATGTTIGVTMYNILQSFVRKVNIM